MAAGHRTLAPFRAQARQTRQSGDYSHAARLKRPAAEQVGALGLVGERTRALLWEGYSLRQAGVDDLALAVPLFETALLLGDLALNRARAVLGLPMVDSADTSVPISSLSAVALRQAEDHYRAARRLAEAEDERLETSWYGDMLLSKFSMLHGVV